MLERFVTWLNKTLSVKQAVLILALCMLVAAAFAFGAAMGQRSGRANLPPNPPPGFQQGPLFGMPPQRGTYGSIDQIDGDVIQMRDPRSGRTWRVRTGNNTVIEAGPRSPIPFNNLRVGQRIFVVGMLNQAAASNEFDAQFIGVVMGQQQNYIRPARPVECLDCTD